MTKALSYTVDGTNAGIQPQWGANGAAFVGAWAWSATASAYVPLNVDASGNLKTTGGGGGSGGSLADIPLVDSTGQLFFFQDTGAGLTGYRLQAGAYVAYTPVSPIYEIAASGQSTVTAQNSQTTLLAQIEANTSTNYTQTFELASQNTDAFNQVVIGQRNNQISVPFVGSGQLSQYCNTVTQTGSASSSWANGQALFSTGATMASMLLVQSKTSTTYIPDSEVFAAFTAYWNNSGSAGTFQRIGLTDTANNGFWIGYEASTFAVSIISGGVVVSTPQASWNTDTLTGGATSKFTSGGVPVALNPSYQNVYRIRFGWLGSASIFYEVYSPDGQWVVFHVNRNPNTQSTPSIQNPNLPVSVWMFDLGNNFVMGSSCWAAGTSSGAMLGTSLTGAPGGDFYGTDILSEVVKGELSLSATISNPELRDVNNALILSDCPAPVRLLASTVGQTFVIDTQGYPTLSLTMGTMQATLTGSNDLAGSWATVEAMQPSAASATATLANTGGYIVPCAFRYLRLVVTTAGWATYNLRNIQSSLGNLMNLPVNITMTGGTASAAPAGQLAIGYTTASNGETVGTFLAPATTSTTQQLKATAGKITFLSASNPNTTAAWLKLFNLPSASVTLGTTSATMDVMIPIGGTLNIDLGDTGLSLGGTGITVAMTGAQGVTNNTGLVLAGQINYAYI